MPELISEQEMKIKMQQKYFCISVRMTMRKANNAKPGQGREETETLIDYCECEMGQPLWKTILQFLKKLNFKCT